ncbi:MAG: asparaginase [Clostridiales bacterium]|nr:asparaginase [Clostridiales bacterium]
MKRILLLSTGDVIEAAAGSQRQTPALNGEELLKNLRALSMLCRADIREVMNIDSTNMQPEEWRQLAQNIHMELDDYDGFVISHGADTMAYTAAALSYMLRGLDKPLILTCSQLSLMEAYSEGSGNIYDAFTVACQNQPGVYVVYAGKIIRGCRAVKVRTAGTEAFLSVNAPLAGTITENRVDWYLPLPLPDQPRSLATHCQSKVLLLKLAPGLEADLVEAAIAMGYRGIVVEGYGAGNVTYARRDIGAALAKAMQRGIAVAITGQCLMGDSGMTLCEPSPSMSMAGVIPCFDMTTEALYVKMCWALGKTADMAELRMIMAQNIAGELE